jgi:hypothetical protein
MKLPPFAYEFVCCHPDELFRNDKNAAAPTLTNAFPCDGWERKP